MEKPRRPILTAPSKISSLSKSSSFTKHQSTTGSSDPATRRVMSPLTKAILLKSSSTPNAETCLISKSNLELSTEKDQYQREKNGFTTDSNSQPETPTGSMPSFQIGLSPVRKLSYTGKTNDTKNINENGLNEPDSKGNNSSEPSRKKDVSATPKGQNSLNSQNRDTYSPHISPNFMKGDSLLDSSETARETEDSKVIPQSMLRGALDAQNSNLTNSGMEDDDSKGTTCDKEPFNLERKTANSVETCDSMDCVKVSEGSNRIPKSAEHVLDENKNNKTVKNGPINVSLTTPQTAAGTPENIDSDSNKTPTTFVSVSSNSTSMVSTVAQEATSELTSHGTFESAVETTKSSQGTLDSPQGTTRTPETLHKPFDAGKVVETSSDFVETPELLGGKISDTFVRTPETFMGTPEISHKCNDVNNKIELESERKEVTETSDVNDFVDSDLTLKKTSSMSDIITCTITTNKDVDNKRHTLQPSVERGRTRIISTNDKSPGVLVDITGQQDTADSQTQPDTKNKKVRSQSPGWNLFSRSRANSKGTNKPSKFRSFFSPKDKDKEKSPKMSPKFKSKNFKLFGKSEDVPQIWEIYDIDTPEGTNGAQSDVLGISNKVQPSDNQVIHPVASESTLRLQNQVQPSNNKIIHPVASEPTILSPSEAEQLSNLNKNHTVQTPVSSVVLDTYSQTHKNSSETPGLDITSDSQNLCEETCDLNSDKNLQKLESNLSAKKTDNVSNYEDVGITILSSVPADDRKVPADDGESDSLLNVMINMKFDNENKQNSEFSNSDDLVVQNSDPNIMLGNNAPKPPVRRHSSKRQIIQLTSVSSMTSGGNSSQEHENVQQVSYLSSRSNMQTPTQHQTSNGSRLSTQNDVDTEGGIKYEMSRNSSSAKSSVPCLNINASILENNVQDVETSPPPIPSPRRRLRRRFSLGPRKLDDDEFIGFASLPEQVHRKAVKRGFEFSLMVVGETGLGKSTLINSLFLTDLYKDRKLPNVQDNVSKTVDISKKSLEIEERGVKLRLTIVDTPGYNDAVNGEECWKNIIDYVDNQFEQYYQAESGLNRKNIQDTRVHCCLYFISPYGHGLKPMDINFMKKLHKKCNIVPLVAKSDILTPKEVKRLKLRILKEIEDNSIEIYQFPDCDSDEDDEFKEQDKALKAAIPFAVVGSNTVVEAGGKRIRGRMYPWGIVEVDNPSHCDFTKLRQMLISTHMQDLKDITSDVHYENYRAEHLASQMNKSQKERSKLKRDSVTNMESVVETEKLLQQKEAEIQRMQAMLAKMQAQLHGGSGQQVNGTVTNTQI